MCLILTTEMHILHLDVLASLRHWLFEKWTRAFTVKQVEQFLTKSMVYRCVFEDVSVCEISKKIGLSECLFKVIPRIELSLFFLPTFPLPTKFAGL